MKWTRIGRTEKNPAGIARYIDTGTDLYIWCHGTSGPRQWRHNFQVKTVKWRGMRVNIKDIEQAYEIIRLLVSIGIYLHKRRLHLYGFSRGGAVAVILGIIYTVDPVLIAPKRAGRKLPTYDALHWPGDLVPFQPFWYTSYDLTRGSAKRRWPHKAHIEAMKYAAALRRQMSKNVNNGRLP